MTLIRKRLLECMDTIGFRWATPDPKTTPGGPIRYPFATGDPGDGLDYELAWQRMGEGDFRALQNFEDFLDCEQLDRESRFCPGCPPPGFGACGFVLLSHWLRIFRHAPAANSGGDHRDRVHGGGSFINTRGGRLRFELVADHAIGRVGAFHK
jgi:hypothetical protein